MHLFRMYWQRSLRRPGSILIWLALPFVFMTIYTMVFGDDSSGPPRTTLAVVDQDSSIVSQLVKGALRQGPVGEMLVVVDAADMTAVDRMFHDEKASAALLIPDGFGSGLLGQQSQTLLLYRNPRHTIGPQIAESIVRSLTVIGDGLLVRFAGPLGAAGQFQRAPSVEEVGELSRRFYATAREMRGLSALQGIDVTIVEEEDGSETDDFNLAAMFFPGLVMFGLLSVSLHLEHRFLRDRVEHVTRRFVTAPVSPWSVAIQQRLYSASFIYVVGVLAALLGGLIWRIPAHGLATANVIVIALVLFVAGFNGILFSLSNSARAVSAISSITMVFLAILGGGFFPAEFTPPSFQAIIKLIPTGMANLGLTHCLTGRPPGISMPLLFAYCGAFFVVGTLAGRRKIL